MRPHRISEEEIDLLQHSTICVVLPNLSHLHQHVLKLRAIRSQQVQIQPPHIVHAPDKAKSGQRNVGILIRQPLHIVIQVHRNATHLHDLCESVGRPAITPRGQIVLGRLQKYFTAVHVCVCMCV